VFTSDPELLCYLPKSYLSYRENSDSQRVDIFITVIYKQYFVFINMLFPADRRYHINDVCLVFHCIKNHTAEENHEIIDNYCNLCLSDIKHITSLELLHLNNPFKRQTCLGLKTGQNV